MNAVPLRRQPAAFLRFWMSVFGAEQHLLGSCLQQ